MSSEEDQSSEAEEQDRKPPPPPAARGAVPRGAKNKNRSAADIDRDIIAMNRELAGGDAAHRGAVPRGAATNKNKRYSAEDIEREIASMNRELEEGDGSSSSSSDSDDDDEEKKPAKKPSAKKAARGGGAINSPVRRTGHKQQTKKSKAAAPKKKKGGGKKKSTAKSSTKARRGKNDDDLGDSDESEQEEAASSEDSPNEGSGEEWNSSNASDASEGESSDDSDSDFGPPSRKKKRGAAAKKKKAATRRGVRRGVARSSGSRSRATPRSSRTRAATTRSSAYRDSSDSASSEEEEEEEAPIQYDTTPSGTRRPRRKCKSRTEEKMHSVVEHDMQTEREALGDMLEEDDKEMLENSDASIEEIVKKAKKKASPKKKSKYDEDGEDYEEGGDDDSGSSSEDEDMSDYEESDDGVVSKRTTRGTRTSPRKRKSRPSYRDAAAGDDSDDEEDSRRGRRKSSRKAKNKPTYTMDSDDEEQIGTADESSDDEATGPSILMSPAKGKGGGGMGSYGSPTSRQRARARMGRTPLDVREDGGSDGSSGSDNDGSDAEDGGSNKPIKHALLGCSLGAKSSTRHVNCPSTTDDITMMNLPTSKPHVCYVAPDGKTRHCFALDTLYRIAISAKQRDGGNNAASVFTSSSSSPLKFLQPPHFRSEMEDDLIDQIASRFGRGALVIENSAVYKKMTGRSFSAAMLDDDLDEFDEDGEYVGHDVDGGRAATGNFQDRFDRYLQNLMGSQDVYCCPLCYNEADRRLGTNGDEEMWEDDDSDADEEGEGDNGDRFAFLDDPLTILGSLDSESFEVASSFCFRLLREVKTHLKAVHNVDLKDVAGNDLFKRFQIRASDGLLQSWLKKNLGRSAVQGDMMRYWLNGENQSFVHLLSQIDRGKLMHGENSSEYSSDFSMSFPNRARRIWRDVSAPYSKQQDMGDFIAEDGEGEESEEEGGVGVPVNPNFTPSSYNGGKGDSKKSPVEQLIENLQRKNRTKRNFDSDDTSGGDGSSDASSDELEVLPKAPQYKEDEAEDEWTKSKSFNAKKKKAKKQKLKSTGEDDSDDDDNVFDSDTEKQPKPKAQKVNGSARKRVIDDDGGDNGNDYDSSDDEKKPKAKAQKMNGSARKRVIESSDEES